VLGLFILSLLATGGIAAAQEAAGDPVNYAASVAPDKTSEQSASPDKGTVAKQGKDQNENKCCPDVEE
jgi:hypothetical protein